MPVADLDARREVDAWIDKLTIPLSGSLGARECDNGENEMTACLILFLIVLGINLLPAFGPPTWSIIVLYGLTTDLPVPLIVFVGALAAALGRLLLAWGFRYLKDYLPTKQKRNLEAAKKAIEDRPKSAVFGLALFALSPLPSAQLFEAAGLAGIRLGKFTAAFFIGRLISYSVYAATADVIRKSSLGDVFAERLTSPWGIAVQIGMIVLLVALAQIDWSRFLRSNKDPQPSA